MFVSVTPQEIIDGAKTLTDIDGYDLVSNTQFVEIINRELKLLWPWARRCNRDAFTKLSSTFSITTGQSKSMTAAAPGGLALTDYSCPRGVDAQFSTNRWTKLKPWRFGVRDRIGALSYRFIDDAIWIMPQDYAPTYPLRVWYLSGPPVASVSALSTAMSIPEACDEYIKYGLAAAIRIRLDDDPAQHLRDQLQAKENIKANLQTSNGDQQVIVDVSEDYLPELW